MGMALLLALAGADVYGLSQQQKNAADTAISRHNGLPSAGKEVLIFLGVDPNKSVRLAFPKEEGCLDIAFLPEKQRLFVLLCRWEEREYQQYGHKLKEQIAKGSHIQEWSETGTLLQDWRLPERMRPASFLYTHHGKLSAVMLEEGKRAEEGKFCEIALKPDAAQEPAVTYLTPGSIDFDTSLNPQRAKEIRSRFKKLNLIPMPSIGQHASPDMMIEGFYVNARDYGRNLADWTSDYTVISLNFQLAVLQANGKTVVQDIAPTLEKFLRQKQVQIYSLTDFDLSRVVVSSSRIAYQIRTGQEPAKRSIVVWGNLPLKLSSWQLKEGYLARPLGQVD